MKLIHASAALLLCACAAAPLPVKSARVIAARRPAFDVEHYRIELEVDPARRAIEGECRVRLWSLVDGLDQVELDLQGLAVRSVADEAQRALRFEQEGDGLRVQLAAARRKGEWTEVRVRYGGTPSTGLHFAAPRDGVPTQAWTQGECDEARGWFPCLDEPYERATHELLVTVPAAWKVVAAGERIERREADGKAVERWRTTYPHPAYLTTLACGELAQAEGLYGSTPLWYLGPEALASELAPAFEETDEILAFFSELTGVRYPHPKYAQTCVDDFHYGGMENISATTLTDTALSDAKGRADQPITGLVAHEAAHQWFGDMLTCAEWSEIWLNEGFATYLTLLWTERSRGRDAFLCDMRDTQNGYIAAEGDKPYRAIVHDVAREPMELFFSGHAYPGGASRLQLLRGMLGDDAFQAALRRWTGLHQNRAVTTAEFVRCVAESSGKDLARYEREWLRSKGHPIVVARHERTGRGIAVVVEQVQDASTGVPAAFAFPLEIEVGDARGGIVRRFEVDERVERFEIETIEPPMWVRLDPQAWVPMDLRHSRDADELLAAMWRVRDAQGRREAAAVLAKELRDGTDEALKARIATVLLERLPLERDARVRKTLVQASRPLAAGAALEPLCAVAAGDADAGVRVAALEVLASIPAEARAAVAARLEQAGRAALVDAPSWAVEGAGVQLLAAAGVYGFDDLRRELEVSSPHGQRATRVVAAIGARLASKDEAARELLCGLALDEARPDGVRGVAIAALAGEIASDLALQRRLLVLLASPRYRVRRAAIEQYGRVHTAQVVDALLALRAESAYDDERMRIDDAPCVKAAK